MSYPLTVLELFAGSSMLTRTARDRGHQALAVDLDPLAPADVHADVLGLDVDDLPEPFQRPDVLWLSPPCTAFSPASAGYHWPDGRPGPGAIDGMETLSHALRLLWQLQPRWWFIENPVGRMASLPFMATTPRRRVHYCQYGFAHQKPTHIWTNVDTWWPRPTCSSGDTCHRSASTGTRGLAGVPVAERAFLPVELCHEVLEAVERSARGLDVWSSSPLFAGNE